MINARAKDVIYYGLAENKSFHPRTKPVNYLNIMTWEIAWDFDKLEYQNKYFNILSEVLLLIYDFSKISVILDAYPLYPFNMSEINSIAHFVQNRKCRFYFDKKFLALTIESPQDAKDFAIELFQVYERFFLRSYRKSDLSEIDLDIVLSDKTGDHENKYIKKIENFESILTVGKKDFFIGMLSRSRTFNQYVKPVGQIINKYGLDFKSISES
jgi:hypothetical protein